MADEQQALMLVRHPDHTVGQARSTSIKPISGRRLPGQSIALFHGPWCAAAHELLLANSVFTLETRRTFAQNVLDF